MKKIIGRYYIDLSESFAPTEDVGALVSEMTLKKVGKFLKIPSSLRNFLNFKPQRALVDFFDPQFVVKIYSGHI